jgi:glycosyltransferase involved in cell wall biosynthesis
VQELTNYCNLLLDNQDLARKIGEAGRQTILERFNITNFVENWNNVFKTTVENYR